MQLLFIFSILLMGISCGQRSANPATGQVPLADTVNRIEDKAVTNALAFINSYVDNCNKMKESVNIVEWVNANSLTTQGFKIELKRMVDQANASDPELGLDADPIFDAQDYPDKGFELDSYDADTHYAVVKGINWPDFKVTIKMVLEKNEWLVDGCGNIQIPKDKRSTR